MNILLVSNDEIVTKMVALSTQKTGDRLDTVSSIDEIVEENYDLLILDDSLFSWDLFERLNDRIIYAHSIYMAARESDEDRLFEKHLYKPFLPTELLFMLHHINAQVKKEQEERSREIVFDDFDTTLPTDDALFGGEDRLEQDALERVQQFERIDEEPIHEIGADEATEEEVLENIFSEEEVSQVKAILDVLGEEEPEEEIRADVAAEEIDQELEAALRNLSETELSRSVDDELLMPLDDILADEHSWDAPQEKVERNSSNKESVEALRALLHALENPQLSKSLRGTITISLTFGEA